VSRVEITNRNVNMGNLMSYTVQLRREPFVPEVVWSWRVNVGLLTYNLTASECAVPQ
jgi:hypothetical protein